MEETLFMDGVRALFSVLDRMVYSLISIFYDSINDLAAIQVVGEDVIGEITGRMYALVGVFMMFKVSFSLINYIVDPDKMIDKTQGAGALIKNVVITFALIVSVPFGFNLLYEAQGAILAEQIIPNFIFGGGATYDNTNVAVYSIKMDGCDVAATTDSMGDYIGLQVFKAFFVRYEDGGPFDTSMNSETIYCKAGGGSDNASVANLLKHSEVYNSPNSTFNHDRYTIDYSFFMSTVLGVVFALLLLNLCFDVAVRTLKLIFYEIIAPIPIISYIDPAQKGQMLSKWFKEVMSTWISLFLRLATIFFAIFVIQQICEENGKLYFDANYNFDGNVMWIKILLMIGLLLFAKQLPGIIENILGIKLSDGLSLDPRKKLKANMLGGDKLSALGAGAIGGAFGAAGGMIAGVKAAHEVGDKGIVGGLMGAVSGFDKGRGDKHAFRTGMRQTYKGFTGNDMRNLDPYGMIMGMGSHGKKKVDAVSNSLKNAKNRLAGLQQHANNESYSMQRSAMNLRNNGVDLNDLAGARNNALVQQAQNSTANSDWTRYQSYMQQLSIATNKSDKKAIKEEMQSLLINYGGSHDELESRARTYQTATQTVADIDRYNTAERALEVINQEINSVNKDISVLEEEKSQRKSYYKIEDSNTKNVNTTMNRYR